MSNLCKCGCGSETKKNNKFLQGHNLHSWIEQFSKEEKLKKYIKAKKSLKLFYENNPNKLIERGIKISITKNTPQGKVISKLAYEKCRSKVVSKLKGRIAWNKLNDSEKIKIKCLNCNKEILVIPFVAKTKKYCCRICKDAYRKGKPLLNWNPSSFNKKTGRGISGEYKEIRFRSSYELSFIKRMFDLSYLIVAEPFRVRLIDYLNSNYIKYYNITNNQFYTPDFLVNNNLVVEIKPQKLLDTFDYLNEEAIYKMMALEKYCKIKNLDCCFITDEMMQEYLLNYNDIKNISKPDIIFYKEKDNERFR